MQFRQFYSFHDGTPDRRAPSSPTFFPTRYRFSGLPSRAAERIAHCAGPTLFIASALVAASNGAPKSEFAIGKRLGFGARRSAQGLVPIMTAGCFDSIDPREVE
jgi:hypothetical protein